MDIAEELAKDLAQMTRLALSGRPQDVQALVVRLCRKYRKDDPGLSSKLHELAQNSPTRRSPLRSEGGMATLPVDRESRLDLLRFEPPGLLPQAPIWSERVADTLTQIVSEHRNVEALLQGGLAPTRTAIFTGPPGVGKTLAARWIASELDRPLLTLDLSAVMSSLLGRTGANVRHVLDYAKGVKCVLLIDELDAIAKRRDDSHEVGELKRLVTVLLQEVDDWPEGGLLLAATNHQDLLDPAVWRRFEVQLSFGVPETESIQKAITQFLDGAAELARGWLEALTELFRGLSFSDIERELKSARRRSTILGRPVEELLPNLVRDRVGSLDKSERKSLALRLEEAGVTQRLVSELTGLSRDTIRRHTRQESQEGA